MATTDTQEKLTVPSSSKGERLDPEIEFAALCEQLKGHLSAEDEAKVQRAYRYAADKHRLQVRASGEPYVVHPVAVARILAEFHLDTYALIAAILHDTVEDTDATLDEIKREFGECVAGLVDGLTKIGKIEFRSKQEKLAENFRKMVMAMASDLRVILVKLADRLHNMRTIHFLAPEKRKNIAQETLDIYAPLANRLGIYGLKSEMEDLCLRELKWETYQDLKDKVAKKKTERDAYIREVVGILENELKKYGFRNAAVYGRPKHFYSIYNKMVSRQLQFEDIHDLFAFRIVVDSVKDCYEALGIVHAMWKPMPGRFKDYIAMPKANLYQSLHTTVIRPNGEPAEIQIRTREMQKICEFGVAAHWAYKEDSVEGSLNPTDLKKFSWLRQIMEWQSEIKDPDEFLEAVKVDLFQEEIFVFTPKGDVLRLPSSATALDFAFAVHTDVGLATIGAKVNGRMISIKKPLRSGDIVEILTSAHQKPNKDWLSFVITSKARNKIRSHLRSEQRGRSRDLGRVFLQEEVAKRGLDLERLEKTGQVEHLIKIARESNMDDVYIALGYGRLDAEELVTKAFPQPQKPDSLPAPGGSVDIGDSEDKSGRRFRTPSHGVLVSGLNNVLVSFARCCNPLPGESITGFVTRGRGVTVHREGCMRANDTDPRRRIAVSWANPQAAADKTHTAFVRVVSQERTGVLAEVTNIISKLGANVQRAHISVNQDRLGILEFELGLQSLVQLQNILQKIESLPAVISVERQNGISKGLDSR